MIEGTDSAVASSSQQKIPNGSSSLKPRRVIRRKQQENGAYQIDPTLLKNVVEASNLPSAYQFEIVKTVQRCAQLQAKHIALQMPEGLLLYVTVLADVLQKLTPCLQQVSILSDVTYGACCVDDLTAHALGCQLLIHYGHSCLVPLQHTEIPVLYVFVEIHITVPHLVDCLEATLLCSDGERLLTQQCDAVNNDTNERLGLIKQKTIYLLGTVQFRHALVAAQDMLRTMEWSNVEIPQVKPLSPGEVLGCTSPVLADSDAVVCFVADGRFHLESTLISNPDIQQFYRYDPYSKTMTQEKYGMSN